MVTSGKLRRMLRTRRTTDVASVGPMDPGRITRTQSAPSSSLGRNSEPRNGIRLKVPTRTTAAAAITARRWPSAQASTGR